MTNSWTTIRISILKFKSLEFNSSQKKKFYTLLDKTVQNCIIDVRQLLILNDNYDGFSKSNTDKLSLYLYRKLK